MSHKLFQITQNLIIKNSKGAILILKDPKGKWLLPGGRINSGENWLVGLKREIEEEIGIKEFIIGEIVDVDDWTEDDNNFYVVTFTASITKIDEIKLSKEHTDFAWVTLNNLDSYDFWHKKIKKRINKSLKQIISPPQPIPSIKIILKHQDKIMLLKLDEDGETIYDLPGGRMDYGEGIFETLKREIKEEIGVSIDFETEPKLLGVNNYLHSKDKVHRLLVDFVYKVPDLIEKFDNQGEPNTSIVWLTKKEINELKINAKYKDMLLSVF